MKPVRVAVQGCCHGDLNIIYQKLKSKKIDLLLITGDFQAIRNITDLSSMAVPDKYKKLGDFHRYYTGQKLAPIPTIFIGGNHESSGYLKELKYGGWVAPNMYFLGEYGIIWYKGLKIGGLSGIYNDNSFNNNSTKDEVLPLNPSSLRSIYHIKPKNYCKLLLLKSINSHDNDRFDIVLSHDWPQYIYNHGDLPKLLHNKPFFKADIESGKLGSPVARMLFNHLNSRYWFSSHLHVLFETTVNYIDVPKRNLDEIDMDMDMEMNSNTDPDTNNSAKPQDPEANESTFFLALDKCGRNRRHLHIMDIKPSKDHKSLKDCCFYYDPRSIVINKVVETYVRQHEKDWTSLTPDQLLNITQTKVFKDLQASIDDEMSKLDTSIDYVIPSDFKIISPGGPVKPPLKFWENNQTLDYSMKYQVPL